MVCINGVRQKKRGQVNVVYQELQSLQLRVSAHTQFPIANVMLAEFVTHQHTHIYTRSSFIYVVKEKKGIKQHVLIFQSISSGCYYEREYFGRVH